MRKAQYRVPFRIALVGAIIGIVLAMAIITALIVLFRGKTEARTNARVMFAEKTENIRQRIDDRIEELTRIASLGSSLPGLANPPLGSGTAHPILDFLFRVIEAEPAVYGAYA